MPSDGVSLQGGSASQPVSHLSEAGTNVKEKGSKAGGVRDRLNKNLTVTTTDAKAEAKKKEKIKVFKSLKEGEKIDDYFDFGEEIYCGGAKGKVLMAKQRSNGDEVVVKVRVKSLHKAGERTWRTVMSQVYGMRDSEHVLDINEIYEDDSHFYVIMPKCNGGELFEFLATETEVPEAECKRIIREILTAVGHLHGNNIVHRDIKPENIMFNLEANDPSSPKTVKLIDFDTCFGWAAGTPKSRRFVGTPGYIAPEALLGEICPQSDLWSIGVILYILMTGEMPWSSLVSLEDGVVGSPGAMRMYNGLKEEVMDSEELEEESDSESEFDGLRTLNFIFGFWISSYLLSTMLPPMKSMKAGGKAMTKGSISKSLATEHGLKQKLCSDVVNSLVAIATQEVKKNAVFTVPGLCRLKTRVKPATKAGVRVMFGKETKVKAKPAKTIVKAYPVAALKKQI